MSETTIDPTRLARAVHLDVQRMTPDSFRVSGGQQDHTVVVSVGDVGCDCVDSSVRGPGCKHELCVRLHCGDGDVVKALRALVAQPQRLRRVA